MSIPDLSSKLILVVDDHVDLVELIQIELQNIGADVVVAHDGDEAMKQLSEKKFDVIISDIRMPRMNGIELARKVRHDLCWDTPVFLLTGYLDEAEEAEALAAGATAVCSKPIDWDMFFLLISSSLSKKI